MTKLLSAVVATIATLGATHASLPALAQTPAGTALSGAAALEPLVIWQAASGPQIPVNAIPGGHEQGKPLAICGASYSGARYSGKVVGNACSFGHAGKEVRLATYDILLGNTALLRTNPNFVRWVPAQSGQVPPGAFMGAREGDQVLPICRAGYQGSVQPGKLVGPACKIAFGGAEVPVAQYEVLVVSRVGTEIPTTTLSAVAANPALASAPATAAARGSSISGIGGVSPLSIQGMDIEAAMMAVQSQRAELLENQLKNQIESVQAKYNEITKLNEQLAALNVERSKYPANPTAPQREQLAKLDGQIQQLKSQLDSLSNSQQMDMLRLQSLSNKRNEAFDLMTNFIKKMQDSRSSIIGNMR